MFWGDWIKIWGIIYSVVFIAQSCPTLCNHMDCSPPGSSVHGILQARILEWVAISFSRGSSRPSDQTLVFCIAGGSLPSEPSGKPIIYSNLSIFQNLLEEQICIRSILPTRAAWTQQPCVSTRLTCVDCHPHSLCSPPLCTLQLCLNMLSFEAFNIVATF